MQVAAVDLGSNSFHMVLAEWKDGQMKLLDKRKEMVRLAAGLDRELMMTDEAMERGLDCLRRFGELLAGMDGDRVRVVGTNTLRAARNSDDFCARAQELLGHPIEVVEGVEEARLIYLGVAHSIQPVQGRQLVVDVGGGSTECVIGRGVEAESCHSLRMGCVSFADGFFPGGGINEDRFRSAVFAASNELVSLEAEFRDLGWSRALGSSGTMKAVESVLVAQGWSERGITRDGLDKLREALIDAGSVDELELDGLSERRRPVFASGAAIVTAVFEQLDVDTMLTSDGALREGVIWELVGRVEGHDLRDTTVEALQHRYGVDLEQARRVAGRLDELIDAVGAAWEIDGRNWRQLGRWAAALHEIGTTVRWAGNHKHGAYLIEHSDLAGFARADQKALAALVLCYRRKFRAGAIRKVRGDRGVRLAALLRLAVRLERARGRGDRTEVELAVDGDTMEITVADADAHPLVLADLDDERGRVEKADLELVVKRA